MSSRARKGIGRSLTALVLVGVLPIVAFSAGMSWLLIDREKAAAEGELSGTSRALTVALDRELEIQITAMQVMATGHSLDSGNLTHFVERARRVMAEHPAWLDVVLVDPHTHLIIEGALPRPDPPPVSSAPAAIDSVVATAKPLIVGAFAKGKIIDKPMILLMTPIIRDGAVRYVMTVVLDPVVISGIFAEQHLPPSWTASAIDAELRIAGRNRSPEQFIGRKATSLLAQRIAAAESGMFQGHVQEGDPVYTVFSRSPVTGWSVAIGIPAGEIEAPIHRMVAMVLTAGAALVALALILAGLVGRAIVTRERIYEAERKAADAELRRSEERFRSLAEGTTDWVWETDAEHRLSWLTSSTGDYVNSPESMIGQRRRDLARASESDEPLWRAHMEDLDAHRAFRDFRYWIRAENGEDRWISASGTPRFGDDGTFLGYRGSSTDVTAEAKAALRLKMLSTVIEQTPVSVVITDPQGAIEYANSHFTVATGYDPEEAVGENPRLFASGETPVEIYQEMWATITSGRRWAGELLNRRKDGELRWEMVVIAPVLDDGGKVAHYVAIKEDVTEGRRLRDQLRQTNAELEQFAYVASHDLRQPLRMVSSYLGLIERRLGPQLTDELKQFFGYAVGGAKQMDRLILDLLEYSRTGKTKAETAVPLDEAINRARLNLTVAIREAGAEIMVTDDLPAIVGDPTELTRLFQNLIGNAVKYRAPDRPPRVEIGCRRQGREWLVSVADNGIGIAPQDRDRAFGIFQRLVGQDEYEGTGIGLAVCKKIVEHHGGRIWIESAQGEGTVFVVAFPAARQALAAE